MSQLDEPCIIGATGGSGTRVVARIARGGGMFIGSHLAPSEDALPFRSYFDRWINAFMDQTACWEASAPRLENLMAEELPALLAEHRADARSDQDPWGWKAPRSIFLLPFWKRIFPGLRFLHVIRDGRDMAFSANQNQVLRHGGALLRPGEERLSVEVRSTLLWSRLNAMAADFGERCLGDAYLRIRYEDLCSDPEAVIGRLFIHFRLEGDIARIAAEEVRPPATIGRWKRQAAEVIDRVETAGEQALRKFGYDETGAYSASRAL
jgi:hypothetical protein